MVLLAGHQLTSELQTRSAVCLTTNCCGLKIYNPEVEVIWRDIRLEEYGLPQIHLFKKPLDF